MHTHTSTVGALAGAMRPQGQIIQLAADLALPGFTMRFARNEEVFGEDEPAKFVYKVLSGAVRTVRISSDGRRQIGAFHMAGAVFGLEASERHRFAAEAMTDAEIGLVNRAELERAAERDIAAARRLWAFAARDLERAEHHMLLLGHKSAAQKVGAFLLDMLGSAGTGNTINLPMSRIDIADYLGLTIETVSRTLTQFARDEAIALPSSRRVVLRDRYALACGDA